jgi:hypothetical protein
MPLSREKLLDSLQRATLDVGSEMTLRAAGQTTGIDADARNKMLAAAKEGRDVRLEMTAITFLQRGNAPNRNHVRFNPKCLDRLARSFKGQPLLRDHNQYDALSRGGTVLASRMIDGDGGTKKFEMTIEVSAPWAVDLALRGLMDRFSIGWNRIGMLECSVCHLDMLDWSSNGCPHYPGQRLEVDGKKVTVEGIFNDAEGVEVSAVSVPAVVGTEVEGIREALAAARVPADVPQPSRKEFHMIEKLRQALRLPATATDEEVIAAAERNTISLAAEKQAREQAQAALADRDATLAAQAAQTLATETERVIEDAVRAGKIIPQRDDAGQRVETPIEASIRHHAKTLGLASAKQIATGLPRLTPVGAPPQAGGADPTPRSQPTRGGASGLESDGKKAVAALSPRQKRLITNVMGVSLEDVAKYGGAPKVQGSDDDDEDQAR